MRKRGSTQVAAGLVAAVAALTLSGCAGTSSNLNGGVASRVGEDTVSMSEVSRLTIGYCEAFRPQLKSQGQIYPMRYLSGYVVGALTLKNANAQLLDHYGLSLPDSYQQTLDSLESQLVGLPEDERDYVREVEGASIFSTSAEAAVGAHLLEQEGTTDADDDAKQARGVEELQRWLADHPATINPRYGVHIADGDFSTTDTSTSFPLSPMAVAADAAQPDQGFASQLPSSQRCG